MTDPLPPLAFIGGGNMASAIISGLCQGAVPPAISVYDTVASVRERHQAAGLPVGDSCAAAPAQAEVLVLAVKPQVVDQVLPLLAPGLSTRHLLISICAGVTCARLEAGLGASVRVVRSMPNTPMAIGAGMVAICAGSQATDDDLALAERLFTASAQVMRVPESRMDAITAISGSGPAYLFHFCEALQAGAEDLGFSPADAALLVGQTVEGAIRYLRSQEGFPAARLREQVTSPGGTTAAALAVLAAGDFPALLRRAMQAACARSSALARGDDQ